MKSNSTIELNVNKSEYQYALDSNERWQKTAEKVLVATLKHLGNQACQYLKYRNDPRACCREKKNRVFAAHDAIFLSAERGGGKTAFLHNVELMWSDALEDGEGEFPSLCFCDPIDPTLLVNNDNFANVVIAQLYNEVEKALLRDDIGELRESFFKRLQILADALAQTEENNYELPGIDKIVGYRCGIQLETAFHDYVEACLAVLKKDAIVIRIDDVDMALKKGFEVLDVVRRLLSCPAIIPIVSGSEGLFKPIVRHHFINGGSDSNGKLLEQEQADKLTDAYLTKIFPSQYRVNLVKLNSLIGDLVIRRSSQKEDVISITDYFELVNKKFCPLVNGQEDSYNRPHPVSPRQLVQMVRNFPPASLVRNSLQDDWYKYQVWAEAYHNGTAYVVSETEQYLKKNSLLNRVVRLDELLALSVLKQTESTIYWKKYDYYNEVLSSVDVPRNRKRALMLSNEIRSSQLAMCGRLEKGKIFRAAPPIEFFFSSLVIPKKELTDELLYEQCKADDKKRHIKLIASLYLHTTYYGTSDRRSSQVFFGRAFELVFGSLLMANSGEVHTVDFWKKYVLELLAGTPFHSIYSLAPTKMIVSEQAESEEDLGVDIESAPAAKELNEFAEKLVEWEHCYLEDLTKCSERGLVHLLVYVMNKVFTQLHVMKDSKIFEGDTLGHAATRFETVLINAFATYLNPALVVLEDVAQTKNTETLGSLSVLYTKTSALRVNVKNFLGVRVGAAIEPADEELSLEKKLLKAIWLHPLFTFQQEPLTGKLGNRNKVESDVDSSQLKKEIEPTKPAYKLLKSLYGRTYDGIQNLSEADCKELWNAVKEEMNRRNLVSANLSQTQSLMVDLLALLNS